MQVDLNADLAEACGNDALLLQKVSSANICCGIHAGDAHEAAQAIFHAKQNGVRIGAHPSFPDRENFGRKNMELSDQELQAHLTYQIGAVAALCKMHNVALSYVKPHGALYNQAANDAHLAQLIAQTVYAIDPNLKLMGLSGSLLLQAAQATGLGTISEVFADRRYLPDGTLVPRSRPDASIHNDDEAIAQVLKMVKEQCVQAIDGTLVSVQADSICLHGDGEHALTFADRIRHDLTQAGIQIRAA